MLLAARQRWHEILCDMSQQHGAGRPFTWRIQNLVSDVFMALNNCLDRAFAGLIRCMTGEDRLGLYFPIASSPQNLYKTLAERGALRTITLTDENKSALESLAAAGFVYLYNNKAKRREAIVIHTTLHGGVPPKWPKDVDFNKYRPMLNGTAVDVSQLYLKLDKQDTEAARLDQVLLDLLFEYNNGINDKQQVRCLGMCVNVLF